MAPLSVSGFIHAAKVKGRKVIKIRWGAVGFQNSFCRRIGVPAPLDLRPRQVAMLVFLLATRYLDRRILARERFDETSARSVTVQIRIRPGDFRSHFR